jgi:hypothetical protein
VRIFHQIDPAGVIPGGIDTFVRGLIKSAPSDIHISVVGLTTDPAQRPVGRWTGLELPGGRVDFFPVARNRNPGGRSTIPLTLKLTIGISRFYRACSSGCDILEFHRFEPVIPFLSDPRPKTAFVHQDMDVIRNTKSDIMWKHLPGLYFALERRIVPQFSSVFGVRADAVDAYRAKYPAIARPNTRLIVVGDGVLRSALVARAQTLGLNGSVVFAGLRSAAEVADLLRLADAFLLSSAYEGMPMSLLEALGCGVPVVTTKVGEVTRVVHHGLNGQVVEDHSVEAFARAILELLSKRDAYRGTPCTEAVRHYVPREVLAPVYQNYRALAGRAQPIRSIPT